MAPTRSFGMPWTEMKAFSKYAGATKCTESVGEEEKTDKEIGACWRCEYVG